MSGKEIVMTAKKRSNSAGLYVLPRIITAMLCSLVLSVSFGEQTKPPATFSDYGRWESLFRAGEHGGFSPDGLWLVYAINRSNGDYELRITKLAAGTTKVLAFGSQPAFSSDSKWMAYSIGRSEIESEKLRSEKKPVQDSLGLLNLATGEAETFEGVESFAFSSDGAYLTMQRYRAVPSSEPTGASGGSGRGESASPEELPGMTIIVRQLAGGRETSFGNVSQFKWQDAEQSHLLAMTISAEDKAGNGVHLFDPEKSVLRVLDSSPSVYTGLVWRKAASDLAVLKAITDEKKEGSTHVVLSWTDIGKAESRQTFDPTTDPTFPQGMRTVSFRSLSWFLDGKVLFFGVAIWENKIIPKKEDEQDNKPSPAEKSSTVEVWHWTDVFVMPWQKIHASEDRQRNMLAAWHLDSGKFVQLGKDPINEQVTPIQRTNLAYAVEWSKYAFERSIGRIGADLYLINISTGVRTKLKENINDRYVRADPNGKFLLFLQDQHYWTIDLATHAIINITQNAPVSFIDGESDSTQKIYPDNLQQPPFGVAGWAKDDGYVLLYSKYDLWQVAADGSNLRPLTDGAAEQVRYRLIRLDQAGGGMRWTGSGFSLSQEQPIDLSQPIFVSLFGEWTKKSGYAKIIAGSPVTPFVWLEKSVNSLAKAKDAEAYAYSVQDYDDSPDIFVCGKELMKAKQVTTTNPFQSDYAWGRSELIDYTTDKGRKMQGALIYPAGYEPGKKYPMIVYNYELLSQNVHRYIAPSDRNYYNISVFSSHGYLVLEPDIVFRIRQPGWSVVECITAGVKKVIDMGIVDPKRIGIIGHSMGGFNTSFVATHTDGLFAAAVAGAPITDLVSYYGDHHWGSGIAETDHIETGQERMEVALYEDLQAYIDNSAVYNAHNMTVPLLLEAGDEDGIVAWYQSIMLYNIARRAKRNVVMLTYMGEDHGLRKKENQQDYQRRILAWFRHYLKDEPAEDWITEGQSFLERDAEVKRLTKK